MGETGENNSSVEDNQNITRGLNFGERSSNSGSGEYLDFEIEINPGLGKEYPVVLKSPAGEAREIFHFPFDEIALENSLKSLQIALLRSGGEHRLLLSPDDKAVQDFGLQLFDNLFKGEIRSRFDTSTALTRQNRCGLRIKLRINTPELAYLPWEFLFDSRSGQYLSLSRDTPIVRYLDLPYPIKPFTLEPPLQILGMICSPTDLPTLRVEIEKQRLEQALEELQRNGLVKLNWLVGQSWRDLHRAMREGPFHIFHFIGHGGFNKAIDQGMLALTGDKGNHETISATDLGMLLIDHRSLRLVFLNSCQGAQGSDYDVFSSTSSILVQQGIPAVLAMQYAITDRAAVEFSRSFYEAIADGLPVDGAVSEARKAIRLAVRNTYEWGTPVLYMRAPQGILFDIPEEMKPKRTSTGRMAKEDLEKEKSEEITRLYHEGLVALDNENWKRATQRFNKVIELDPGHAEASGKILVVQKFQKLAGLYTKAQAAIENQEWEGAIGILSNIETEVPDYKDVKVLLRSTRRKQCDLLYEDAKNASAQNNWDGVITVFDRIDAINPYYPDEANLLSTAQNHIAKRNREIEANNLYDKANQMIEAKKWFEAQDLLLQVQELSPGYKDSESLLNHVKMELIKRKDGKKDKVDKQPEFFHLQDTSDHLMQDSQTTKRQNKIDNITQEFTQYLSNKIPQQVYIRILGLLLILIGGITLCWLLFYRIELWWGWRFHWSIIVIIIGLVIYILGFIKIMPNLMIPAVILTGCGFMLWEIGYWGNWGLLDFYWTLIPGFIGIGILLRDLLGNNFFSRLKLSLILILVSSILFITLSDFIYGWEIIEGIKYSFVLLSPGLILLGIGFLKESFLKK